MVHLPRNPANAGLSGVPRPFSCWYTHKRKLSNINDLGCTTVYREYRLRRYLFMDIVSLIKIYGEMYEDNKYMV